jgi:hypothetical protein
MVKLAVLVLALGLAGCGTYGANIDTPYAGAGARLSIGNPPPPPPPAPVVVVPR